MSLVVDASVVVKWYVDEPRSDAARRLLASDELLVSPAHVEAEVGQVLRRRVQASEISLEQAIEAAAQISDTLVLTALASISKSALEIACGASVSFYDALYVAAAIQWAAPLATDDRRLANAVGRSDWADRVSFILLDED